MSAPRAGSTSVNERARTPVWKELDSPSEQNSAWISREVQALVSAWSRGERVRAEDLLARHPGLGDEAAIRLIYEEVRLRRESGEDLADDGGREPIPALEGRVRGIAGLRPHAAAVHPSIALAEPR